MTVIPDMQDDAPPDGLARLRAEIGGTIGTIEQPTPDDPLVGALAHVMGGGQGGPPAMLGASTGAGDPMGDDPTMDARSPVTDAPLDDSDVKAALAGLYGEAFPLLSSEDQDSDWIAWAESLWRDFSPGVYATLHLVERNRLFYQGNQWLSAIGYGPWREPPKPRDVVRTVRNKIKPALDMRTQILAEQRPGFNCTPASGDPQAAQRAEADQVALEWSWHEQDMAAVALEAGRRVGTDAVTFLELWWDPDAGPWYQIPTFVAPEQAEFPLGKKPGDKFPMGDIRTKVRSIEQVRVSSEATATKKPMIWVVREVIAKRQAILEHGPSVAKESGHGETDDDMQHITAAKHGLIMPNADELLREQESVVRLTVYCERSEFVPQGLMMVAVGQELAVAPTPLPYGVVPMVRWTDGTTDPSFYPMAVMVDWLDSQMRINAIVSKWIEAIRKGANANFLGRGGVMKGETLIGGTLNVYEVNMPAGIPLSEAVQPIGPFDISTSAERALAQEIKEIEDLTGVNDATRGSMPADSGNGPMSGRAILAVREQVERIFAPFVNAASRAMCEWGEITLHIMKANYDLPRMIAVQGADRPDLARLLSSDDLDIAAQVWVDPETLMPMPRSMRMAVLEDMLSKGAISMQEYRRRMPFAMVRSLESPDDAQTARAHRVAEAIRRTGDDSAYPILWMTDESVEQDVLDRQIIFDDSLPQNVRSVAYERWMRLAQQAQEKQQGMAMPPGEPQPPQQPPQGAPLPAGGALPGQTTNTGMIGPARMLGAGQAPLGAMSPVASQPMTQIGLPDALQAASRFERTAPQ